MLDQVTPLLITFDEAPNIQRIVDKLVWAKRIVVIDSGSTDETLQILRAYSQVDVFHRKFDKFASQCNFGLAQIFTPWVLSLDADYELSEELLTELKDLKASEAVSAYRVRFVYRIHGRRLRGSLYPPRTVLYRKDKALYENEGHGHRVRIEGVVKELNGVIYHDDRKPLRRWLRSQQRYAREEADYLLGGGAKLSRIDRVRAMGYPAPILVVFYVLFIRGCIFDGWAGWHYTLQRLLAEALISLEVVDRRLREKAH
jgi:glycosyltransferase involved in cell wall biosynthesis